MDYFSKLIILILTLCSFTVLNAKDFVLDAKEDREVGPGHTSEIRKTFPNKDAARTYETNLIERIEVFMVKALCQEIKLIDKN